MYAEALREHAVDAWALWDFRGSNPVFWNVLGMEPPGTSRRAVLIITPERTRLVCSVLDRPLLESAGVELDVYSDRRQFVDKLALSGRVAMEYSPLSALPIVGFADAGAVELVRSLGAEVVSSADLFQAVAAAWDAETERSHHEAVVHVMELHALAREHARGSTERSLVGRITGELERRGLETDGEPGVSTGPSSGDPHHEAQDIEISDGVLLVDIWARLRGPRTAFADVTWMSCLGDVPPQVHEVVAAVVSGRDAALAAAQPGAPAYEADRAARTAIEQAGYGHGLMHRTGHSLSPGRKVHGLGANLDDTETHDDRTLTAGTAFTVEPGVYLPEFGVRLECNVLLRADRAEVTTPLQAEITPLP